MLLLIQSNTHPISKSLTIIHDILEKSVIPHEFKIIDDGSKDNSWEVIKQLSTKIHCIRAIRLSRNFGKEAALFAGIEIVEGDACIRTFRGQFCTTTTSAELSPESL